MLSESYLQRALTVATDTRAFELRRGDLSGVVGVFQRFFSGKKAIVVSDAVIWPLAGEKVFSLLRDAGIEVSRFLIEDDRFQAEFKYVEQIQQAIREAGAYAVAVGSGVVNDLCKLASHRLRKAYVCVPTAASVDGYCSYGASIIRDGLKQTFACRAPIAVIADVDILVKAPRSSRLGGYGDLAAKTVSGAEWILADGMDVDSILPDAWNVIQLGLKDMLADPVGVGEGSPDAVESLFCGLTYSGIAIQVAHSSRPASGSEHLFSHYLDMTGHTFEGRPQSHGFQVAIGTLVMSAFFEEFLRMDMGTLDVEACVAAWPTLVQEQERARDLFRNFPNPDLGNIAVTQKYHCADKVREQLTLLRDNWAELRERCRERLYSFKQLTQMFKTAGVPYLPSQIGLTRLQLREMVPFVQMMRNRLNLLDIARRAGVYDYLVDRVFGPEGIWVAED